MTRPVTNAKTARFGLGQIVRHRDAAFRGVIIDVDPVFDGPTGQTGSVSPDQPFYQVLAVGEEGSFIAYAPQDILEHDPDAKRLTPDDEARWFTVEGGRYAPRAQSLH